MKIQVTIHTPRGNFELSEGECENQDEFLECLDLWKDSINKLTDMYVKMSNDQYLVIGKEMIKQSILTIKQIKDTKGE